MGFLEAETMFRPLRSGCFALAVWAVTHQNWVILILVIEWNFIFFMLFLFQKQGFPQESQGGCGPRCTSGYDEGFRRETVLSVYRGVARMEERESLGERKVYRLQTEGALTCILYPVYHKAGRILYPVYHTAGCILYPVYHTASLILYPVYHTASHILYPVYHTASLIL